MASQDTTPTERPGAPIAEASAPATAHRTRRRRRPSGAPPPLPRNFGLTSKGWLIGLVVLAVWVILWLRAAWARRVTGEVDAAISRALARRRVGWLNDWMRTVDQIAAGWTMFVAAVVLLGAMLVFRRWRHLFTYLAAVVALQFAGAALLDAATRPRPYDVTIIGEWQGYSLPSATVAVVSFTVVGCVYALVVPGRPRTIAKFVGAVVIGLVVFARLYLGVDHPFDVVVGVALGVGLPLLAFRFFTPNELFPVTYRRGKTAHLDVTGRRAEAIQHAVEDQLGIKVVEIKPVGLAGSGGSTPLRLRVAGEPDTHLFGKLYAMNHVRADRWYKLGRTILYGRLEDERPFQSVRRLVQHEDYAMRLLCDAGIPTAHPMGVVELTPEREYLMVTEFFDGAVEIGEAEVDDQIIDEGLALIRQLWDAGIAHRDIKPANLLVLDGHLRVIDVAFVQVRPSPWREAVDLANMMLVLAVRTDAERVYRRALAFFTPDEIAEAFAAVRGIASPTELRTVMKRDGRDLVAQFRALAPQRQPISLQRWGPRRVLLVLGLAVGTFLVLPAVYSLFVPVELSIDSEPVCGTDDLMTLMAQAVPTASAVPCVGSFPAGWESGAVRVSEDRAQFRLEAEDHRVEVTLRPLEDCSTERATEIPSDEVGMRRFEEVEQLPPDVRVTRTYLADGGCITYDYAFDDETTASLVGQLDSALQVQRRDELVANVEDESRLTLCGAAAPPCVGGLP
jgi:membrane-associated phospholipid phosphatase